MQLEIVLGQWLESYRQRFSTTAPTVSTLKPVLDLFTVLILDIHVRDSICSGRRECMATFRSSSSHMEVNHRHTVLASIEDLQAFMSDPITSATQTLKASPVVFQFSLESLILDS